MAGPSVAVRVIGDTTTLQSGFDDAGAKSESAGSRIHSAFSSALATINQTGVLGPFGDALATIDDGIGKVIDNAKKIGPAMMAAGGTAVALGGTLTAIGDKDKAAQQQLQAAIEATGASYDTYADQVDAAVKHQEKFGTTADDTMGALQTLTQATHDPAEAIKLLGEASDLAAAKHEDLNTAATAIGKTFNGNNKLLTQYGVQVQTVKKGTDDAATATKIHEANLSALAGVLSGQASAASDTFTGKLKGIKAEITDQVSEFGQKYGPAITAAGAAMTGLGAVIEVASNATKIWTGIQAAFDVVMDANPIMLVAIAIAALVAGVILAYDHFAAFRDLVNTGASVIVSVFDGIKRIAEDVFSWIANNWPLLVGILFGPFGLATALIVTNWNSLVSFFSGIAGSIAHIFAGIWDPIYDGFKAVINNVIGAWNSLHFTLPEINIGPVHVGGETIGVPQIPKLATGGYITSGGLAMLHAGETVSPAGVGAARGNGPAVVIENASFGDGADIDLFLRKVAFAATAGLL